jgi:serine/threonine protein kinase
MAFAAGTRLGPNLIAEPIGSAGMGEVYRAKDTTPGRDVAIKVLPATRRALRARRTGELSKVLAARRMTANGPKRPLFTDIWLAIGEQ